MVHRYNTKIGTTNPEKHAKTHAKNVRVHFKNTYAVGRALKGMQLQRAKKYLNNVLRHTEAVPFYRFRGGPGRHAAAKQWGSTSQVRWPTKSVFTFLKLLQNAEANAVSKGLDAKKLNITHVIVNQAPKLRRRTYRAHGRIGPYQTSPSHLEIVLSEQQAKTAEAPKTETKAQ